MHGVSLSDAFVVRYTMCVSLPPCVGYVALYTHPHPTPTHQLRLPPDAGGGRPGKKQKQAAGPQMNTAEKAMLKAQFRSHLAHQLHRLNVLRCPAALEASCSLAGDLWRCGDTKGVRCILAACFRERNVALLTQVSREQHE
jgi:hypothetical protein